MLWGGRGSRFPSCVREPVPKVFRGDVNSGPRMAFVNQASLTKDLVNEVLHRHLLFSSDLS